LFTLAVLTFFRTYSPQGDGNYIAYFLVLDAGVVFQNLFPARGRKLSTTPLPVYITWKGFSEPIPRKGTETYIIQEGDSQRQAMFFRTYSPQGDGNVISVCPCPLTSNLSSFSEPIPRKGTETLRIMSKIQKTEGGFSEPIPRKGTETSKVD